MSQAAVAPFLKDTWYMAAWSHEIGQDPARRLIAGEPILLYRRVDGTVVALTDRCPHRFAPLSQGVRVGDDIRCPYHGLTFSPEGRCVHNPFSDHLPKGAGVRTWPVAELWGGIWLWAGDSTKADQSGIPDFSRLTARSVAPICGHMPLNAPYQFGTDNLMDLSHIEFVHLGSFAGGGVIFAGQHDVQVEGDTIRSDWWMPDVPTPIAMPIPEKRCDHWLEMRWDAPATMLLEIGATRIGDARSAGAALWQAHIITPATETTAHYFWATTPLTDDADADSRAFQEGLMRQAFETEDKPVIESSFANLLGQEFWSQQPLSLGVDKGGAMARRKIQAMLRQEAAPQTGPAL